jgi:hypothetical protein
MSKNYSTLVFNGDELPDIVTQCPSSFIGNVLGNSTTVTINIPDYTLLELILEEGPETTNKYISCIDRRFLENKLKELAFAPNGQYAPVKNTVEQVKENQNQEQE